MRGRAIAALLAMALAGCGSLAPAATPTPEPTPAEIAQRAADKLSTLTSFHFDLTTDTGGKPLGTGFSLISAKGDAAKPDKLSAMLQANLAGFTASLSYVSVEGKHYMTDPISQQWMEVPPQFNTIAVFSPSSGAPSILKGLSGLANQGTEAVDGAASYHLAGSAAGDATQPFLGTSAPAQLRAEAWIGTSDFLTRRITLTGVIFPGEPDTTVRTLLLTRFNEPVTITAPTPGTR